MSACQLVSLTNTYMVCFSCLPVFHLSGGKTSESCKPPWSIDIVCLVHYSQPYIHSSVWLLINIQFIFLDYRDDDFISSEKPHKWSLGKFIILNAHTPQRKDKLQSQHIAFMILLVFYIKMKNFMSNQFAYLISKTLTSGPRQYRSLRSTC